MEAKPSSPLLAVPISYSGKLWEYKREITRIVFEDTLSPKVGAAHSYDISSEQDKSIMSYLVANDDDTTKYTAYIQANGKVQANLNSSFLFYGFSNLTSIVNLDRLDTSNVTDMHQMFDLCGKLTTLDVSNFDTSKVTDMSKMFCNCSSLTALDLSNFDTNNVINMDSMFHGCKALTTTITIRDTMCTNYTSMFSYAATNSSAKIIVNYTANTSKLVDKMVATKSSNSNVVKEAKVYTISISGTADVNPSSMQSIESEEITLTTNKEGYSVTSFKLNGVLVEGNSFLMPGENAVISDIVLKEGYIIESAHNPYQNNLDNKEYFNKTFDGATSLTVILEYQTQKSTVDLVYLYNKDNKTYGKFGGKTPQTETITIPGDTLRIVFRTDGSGNNYYGFKATITPNYD